MLLAIVVTSFGFTACGNDDDEPENGNSSTSEIVGNWHGNVYADGEASDYDECTVELTASGIYKDYNKSGILVGNGTYSYDGNTITIPASSLIAGNWGEKYTVTISGNTMIWKNASMTSFRAEYRFTKR